jgi:NADPH:quinone reductase-like Zn-dependent oxidoreductase
MGPASKKEYPMEVSETTMRAITQRRYGNAEVLTLNTIDRPMCGAEEILVKVKAAGLDRGTWHLMTGLPLTIRLGFGLRGPKNPVPGLDLSGTVVATGSGTSRFKVGDEVFGIGKGSFAEFAVAKESKLALKPPSLGFEQAAAIPVSGMTALLGLCDFGQLKAKQKVLIIGASGGVGTYAVQIAKALGAEVTGVCSTSKIDLVRSLGATHIIDYTKENLAEVISSQGRAPFDLIFDLGGSVSLRKLVRALSSDGSLVLAGGEQGGKWFGIVSRSLAGVAMNPFVKQRIRMLVSKEHHTHLERLSTFVTNGELTPSIDHAYPLTEAAQAMRHLESGRARGKIVITVEKETP